MLSQDPETRMVVLHGQAQHPPTTPPPAIYLQTLCILALFKGTVHLSFMLLEYVSVYKVTISVCVSVIFFHI